MNHYPKHVGDWITATAHLTEVEECIYSRMIDQYYARESPLSKDVKAVARLVRASTAEARRAVPSMLEEFFALGDDGWHQKRCDEEIAAYRSKAAKASASAAIGWAKRKPDAQRTHQPTNANAYANASTNAQEMQCLGNANQNQNHNQGVKPELCTDRHGQSRSKPMGDKSPVNGQNRPKPGWHRTADGINATGKMLGIDALPGESTPAYKARLFEAIKGH